MSCTTVRIDALDFNGTGICQNPGPLIYDTARGKVYFTWASREAASGGVLFNKSVYFREFDVASESFLVAPVRVHADDGSDANAVATVRLSTGKLVVGWGDVSPVIQTSTDNGVNWSGTVNVGAPASFYETVSIFKSPNDDLYFIGHQVAGGGGQGDTHMFKSTNAGATWAEIAAGLLFDGTATVQLDCDTTRRSATRIGVMKADNVTGCVVISGVDAGNNTILYSFYTTNAWTTFSTAIIKTTAPVGGVRVSPLSPQSWLLPSGRIVSGWVERAGGANVPNLAYSDDGGATWTEVGSPPAMAGYSWDPDYNRMIVFDGTGGLFLGTISNESGIDWFSRIWRNTAPATTGWVTDVCDYVANLPPSGSSAGDGFVVGANVYRVFHQCPPAGAPTYTSYNLIIHHNVVPHGNLPICTVVPLAATTTGASATFCGPTSPDLVGDPWTYAWTGPSGYTATTQCITVSVAGTYNLTVSNAAGSVSCLGVLLNVPPPPEATASGPSIPHRRGDLHTTESGHPAGNPSVASP